MVEISKFMYCQAYLQTSSQKNKKKKRDLLKSLYSQLFILQSRHNDLIFSQIY